MAKICEYGTRLATMTEQEVFDAGARHLLTQNKKSENLDEDGECVYNGEDGSCCAAAPFLPRYTPSFEGLTWDHLVYRLWVTPKTR